MVLCFRCLGSASIAIPHGPVGAHEHREAAMAVRLIRRHRRHRCLAVLVSSYRKPFQFRFFVCLMRGVGGYDGDEYGAPGTPRPPKHI